MKTSLTKFLGERSVKPSPASCGKSGAGLFRATLGLLLIGVCGCQVAPPEQKIENAVHAPEDIAATQQQIRVRMRALVEPLSGAIIESADQIMAGTTNHLVRREALLWKMEAVPALRECLFRPSPFVAIMDTWVLTLQMADYFESERGRDALGDAAPIAVRTCRELAAEIETVAASMTLSGDVSDAREYARNWAREHPIQYSIQGRESTVSRVTEREIKETFSTQEVAGNVVVTLDDLNRRMDVYSAQLLDEARWQAELFAMDLVAGYQLEQAMPLAQTAVQSATEAVATVKRLEPAVQETLAVAKTAPELISSERVAAIEAAHAEISRSLEFVTQEREAALRELSQTIAEERKIILADAEQIAENAVDHAMLRIAQLTAAVLISIFVGVVILLFITRRVFVERSSEHSQ